MYFWQYKKFYALCIPIDPFIKKPINSNSKILNRAIILHYYLPKYVNCIPFTINEFYIKVTTQF